MASVGRFLQQRRLIILMGKSRPHFSLDAKSCRNLSPSRCSLCVSTSHRSIMTAVSPSQRHNRNRATARSLLVWNHHHCGLASFFTPHVESFSKRSCFSTQGSDNDKNNKKRTTTMMEQLGLNPDDRFRPTQRVHSNKRMALLSSTSSSSSSSSSSNRRHRNTRNQMPKAGAAATQPLLYPVRAVHISQTIDLSKMMSNSHVLFANTEQRKVFGKNSMVVQLGSSSPSPPLTADRSAAEKDETQEATSSPSSLAEHVEVPRYVAVFRFGSVVFLNIAPNDITSYIQKIKQNYATDPVLSGSERMEHFGVMIQPPTVMATTKTNTTTTGASAATATTTATSTTDATVSSTDDTAAAASTSSATSENDTDMTQQQQSQSSMVVTPDFCIVSKLDLNSVAVISNILAQTVALDTYNDTVDEMLRQFAAMNSSVRSTGTFQSSHKQYLFRTVAQNNAIFIDMISKIRLKDRSDTAWTMTQYESIHYGLKAEFEIDDRFDQIEFKLNLMQQNAKFFLQVLQSQKSNTLEWIIVVLIAVECLLMTIDMSGMGEALFETARTVAPNS